jgi:Gametolysin peptidase M11
VTIKAAALDAGNGRIQEEEDVVCIKQVDREDSTTILSLADLPSHVYRANEKQIVLGRLYMSLTGITVQEGNVIMSNDTEFTVIENNVKIKLDEGAVPIGNKTLAIVRISTRDAQVAATANELENTVLAEGPQASNVMSQFRKMSFGQLVFQPKGVHEVYIDQSISFFTGANISTAAEIAMVEQLGLEKASDLADRVLFCVPPGLQRGFIAFTYINHWRATFSDKWCHSLTATIHEIGHTFGLGHSHWEGLDDYQDLSCYMGLGGGDAHAPRQSFNAHKGWQTGWYFSRHLSFDPFTEEPRRIDVAALVDYEKTSDGQAVIVNIADLVYFQYNRAKGFNNETRAMSNKLVIVEAHGNGNSGRIAALNASDDAFAIPNFLESGQRLVIEVCGDEFGDAVKPDIMAVSVGFGESSCSSLEEPPPPPSSPRPSAPTRSPRHAPSHAPSSKPSALPLPPSPPKPTTTPNVRAPTHSPRHAPSHAPTATPSSLISITPSSAPSPSSSHVLSPSPRPLLSTSPSRGPPEFPLEPSTVPSRSSSHRSTLSPSSDAPTPLPSIPPPPPLLSQEPSFSPNPQPSTIPSSRPQKVSTPSPSSEEDVSRADEILKRFFESFFGTGK